MKNPNLLRKCVRVDDATKFGLTYTSVSRAIKSEITRQRKRTRKRRVTKRASTRWWLWPSLNHKRAQSSFENDHWTGLTILLKKQLFRGFYGTRGKWNVWKTNERKRSTRREHIALKTGIRDRNNVKINQLVFFLLYLYIFFFFLNELFVSVSVIEKKRSSNDHFFVLFYFVLKGK